jgi:MFS family permease
MKFLSNKSLDKRELKTFKLHGLHMVLEGIIDGALLLNEFVLIKSLHGSNYQISYLFQYSVIIFLFSVLFNKIVKRSRNKKRLLIWVGIITRLPLAVMAFFPRGAEIIKNNPQFTTFFLLVFLVYYLYKPVILPTINLLLRHNYSSQNFGKLYSYATTLNKIIIIIVTYSFGRLLDFDHFAFTYIYPALSVLGILSIALLTRIDYTDEQIEINYLKISQSIKKSLERMAEIVIRNKPYRDFELGFMFYGLAWMATIAVVTIFMEKQLHLSYASIAFYKNTFNLVAIICLPFLGKLIGKVDPRKFGAFAFSSLLLHLLLIILTLVFPYNFMFWGFQIYPVLVLSFIANGIFTAAMALLWGIGSSYFCKKEEASDYQSVHLSLVGFRGLFAPIMGVFIFESIGFTGAFATGIILLLSAILIMLLSIKKRIL